MIIIFSPNDFMNNYQQVTLEKILNNMMQLLSNKVTFQLIYLFMKSYEACCAGL